MQLKDKILNQKGTIKSIALFYIIQHILYHRVNYYALEKYQQILLHTTFLVGGVFIGLLGSGIKRGKKVG